MFSAVRRVSNEKSSRTNLKLIDILIGVALSKSDFFLCQIPSNNAIISSF